ncbi:hypothetical protein WN943_007787 [Citrus x changshan-huyou]
MSHNHILKLIGCCLETPIPILVFESVQYGTLWDRILGAPQPHFEPLLLKHRLKIAMDIVHALAYLHFGFPRPIVFRNFKTSCILFNEENVAKLFDFSLSISIPEGETHITDTVMGTLGYCAPEYMRTEYGNLHDLLNRSYQSHSEPLLLKHRLKIAMEIANVFAYLHIGFSRPIVFREISNHLIS